MTPDWSALLEVTPALAILEDSSRFLLTLGVGLFLAYVVLIVGANLIGFVHRRIATAIRPHRPDAISRLQPVRRTTVQVREVSRAAVLESEVH